MTVEEFYEKFKELVGLGKGEYRVLTEGCCVELDARNIEICDDNKQINL